MKKNNNTCNIVKDLSTLYIDNMISPSTKEFIKNHLSTCLECNDYYNNMNSDILNELHSEKRNDDIEFTYLKKINNKITILKIFLTIILSLIILSILYILIKNTYINNISSDSSSKIYSVAQSNNYKLIEKSTYKDLSSNSEIKSETIYYYKDGKYKIDSGDTISYLEDDNLNYIIVNNDSKTIEYKTTNFPIQKGNIYSTFYSYLTISNFGIGFSIRSDDYDNQDCYVIKKNYENGFIETWINKNNNLIARTVESFDYYYEDTTYSFEENASLDSDIDNSILNEEEYKNYSIINSNN